MNEDERQAEQDRLKNKVETAKPGNKPGNNPVNNAAGNLAKKGVSAYLGAHGIPPQVTNAVLNSVTNKNQAKQNASGGEEGAAQGKNANPLNLPGNPMNQAANSLLSSAGDLGEGAGKAVDIAKKAKLIYKLLPIIGGFLAFLFVGLIIYIIVMAPILAIGEKIDEIKTGVMTFGNKIVNFMSGDGFLKSVDVVANKIDEAEKNYESNTCAANFCYEGNFDEGVLLATIHTNSIVDVSSFDDTESEVSQKEYNESESSPFGNEVEAPQVNSFYNVQSMYLGDVDFTLNNSNKGLIYNLVDYKIGWTCKKSGLDEALTSMETLVNSLDVLKKVDLFDTMPVVDLIGMLRDIMSSKEQNIDYVQYAIDKGFFKPEDVKKKNIFLNLFTSTPPVCENQVNEDGEEIEYTAAPVLVKYQNYNNYFKYVKDVIIKNIYFDCLNCNKNYSEEEKQEITTSVIREIVDKRNDYYQGRGENNYLLFSFDENGDIDVSVNYSGYVSNIPVGTSGTGWTQNDPNSSWSSIELGNGPGTTMAKVGCYVTSISILMANSGTQINSDTFDPGVLANELKSKHAFSSGGSLQVHAWQDLVPNFVLVENYKCSGYSFDTINTKALDSLSKGYHVMVQVHGGGHFVAVVGVENGEVIISETYGSGSDPSHGKLKKLSDYSNYKGGITSLRIFKG